MLPIEESWYSGMGAWFFTRLEDPDEADAREM